MNPPAYEPAAMIESLREELRAMATPWRTRAAAAAYLGCTPAFISMLVQKGELDAHYLCGMPRFKVSDLDKLITKKRRPFDSIQKAAA